MYSKYDRPLRSFLPFSKFLLISLFMCVFFLIAGACTKDEPQEVRQTKIVVPIKKPMPEPPAPLAQEDTTEKEEGSREKQPLPLEDPSEPPEDIGRKEGCYRVQKGESLITVAGLEQVYNDPSKWTSLFRMNMDRLNEMEITADFHSRELPEGLELKFVTESEAEENLIKLGPKVYAVNVLSAENSKKVVPRAITLMKNGYNVYICTAMVKGKKWLRLRAGFFKSYSEAATAGEQIKDLLDGTKVWIARIDKSEQKQYGGY